MGFFHKLKMFFVRFSQPSIPRISEAKKYGNYGEIDFANTIHSRLPDAKVKKNVIITTDEGNAEIDLLVLYKNKLFAIEFKRWKGHLFERDGFFIQKKEDRWTGEIHSSRHKSPFKQLGRAIYLLRKQIPQKAWLNAVVFFDEAVSIRAGEENVWFSYVDDLADYIINKGEPTAVGAEEFFRKCRSADYLYSLKKGRSLQCSICDEALHFRYAGGILTRKDIVQINIRHHLWYDELAIHTVSGKVYLAELENGSVMVEDNGRKYKYAFCKLERIVSGGGE